MKNGRPRFLGVMVTNRGRLPELISSVRRVGGFQLRHTPFKVFDPGARTRQYLGLDVEFFTGNQLEMAQSLRQDIAKIGAQVLVRVYHPWRNQRDKSKGNLVDILPPHHGRHLELVGEQSMKNVQSGAIGVLHQNV